MQATVTEQVLTKIIFIQVEVPSDSFITDYSDSTLVHRSVIEDLNATIRVRLRLHTFYMWNILEYFLHVEYIGIYVSHVYYFVHQSLGDAKINIMVESKDFRKGIHALEW